MKLFFTSFLLLITSFCFSQKRNVYFLKNDGTYLATADSADYIRILSEPDSGSDLYNVQEYYKNRKMKLIGKSSAIDPPRYEGQCITFNKDGKKKSMIQYKNGIPIGDAYYFFPNGRTFKVIAFQDSTAQNIDLDGHFLIKESYDSLGTAVVINSNGYFKGYAGDSTETDEEGQVKDGKRDSAWKGGVKALHVTFAENYANGTLLTGTATYDDGQIITYSKTRETMPDFKGGINGFYNFLAHNIRYPAEAREKNLQGKVIIGFIVDRTGKVSHVKVLLSVAASLDAEAIRVISSSPPWIPATRFGRPVMVSYAVPLSFTLSHN